MAAFDEAMLNLADPAVSPVTAGFVYCTMIEGCQEISDFGRAAEWTGVLQRWCEQRPGLVAFTGQCAVHRGQLMRAQGAWDEALAELEVARRRYVEAGSTGARRAGRLRDRRGAPAAWRPRGGGGGVPGRRRPRLRPATRAGAAVAGAGADPGGDRGGTPPARRGDRPRAPFAGAAGGGRGAGRRRRTSTRHARWPPSSTRSPRPSAAPRCSRPRRTPRAWSSSSTGDPAGALPYLRKAGSLCARVEDPYAAARVRVLTGRALAALGDDGLGPARAGVGRPRVRGPAAPGRTRAPYAAARARTPPPTG